ncbi:MAG: universal stress protein [Desulfocapsaceae bacterium]|nr:universal stress protein [Desulfocapsaceae bacterium]
MIRQILIATDGSTFSNQALIYAARLFGGQPEITFHLLNCTPPGHGSLPEPADSQNTLFPSSTEGVSKSIAANSCLRQAKERLCRLGIAAERITASVVSAGRIAQAIQNEAERLLVDCILVARRGIGFVGEMLLGSVSADLFKKCHLIPLWIIDGETVANNVLISVDGTCQSLMAVDHAAHILSARDDIQIFLFYSRPLFQRKAEFKKEQTHPRWGKQWCETYLKGENAILDGPRQLLLEADIPSDRITLLPMTTHIDGSSSIISRARQHHCGTIVMGRVSRAMMRQQLWGQTADRTIKNTQNMALWVVG